MKKGVVFLAVSFISATLMPNGSPINTGEILRTGNIQMIQKKNIRLLEEDLAVRIEGDYASVRAVYRLRNYGPEDIVTYGFPVVIDRFTVEERTPPRQVEPSIRDFTFVHETGGKAEELPLLEQIDKESLEERSGYPVIREWRLTQIPFEEDEEKIISVGYRVKSQLEDIVFSKHFRPVFSKRTFSYSLKPSQNWGEGIVPRCTIKIDVRDLLKKKGVISVIFPAEGYDIKDGIISWDHHDLDLKKAEDIQIVYDNEISLLTEYIRKNRLPGQEIKSVKASSVLKQDRINRFDYNPPMMFDSDFNTAWVEGAEGSGEGEWTEIELADSVSIEAIGMINGYTKNEAIYYANSRIKRIRLDTEYVDRYSSGQPRGQDSVEIDLDQKSFNELNRDLSAPFINWLADYGDGRMIKKLRLTILEVYSGSKYDDSCIAELLLLGNRFSW